MSQHMRPLLRRLRFSGLLGVLLLAGAVLSASPARAWWNGDWSYRMKIVADASPKGAAVSEIVGRTQILVRLHAGNFNFATAKDDGSDVRLVGGDDRTPLHFHIERFDGLVDQVGLIWVDVTDLAPGVASNLFVYWGNKNATSVSDSRATYDADQVLAYHFADDNGLPRDATGFGNNALTPGKRDPAGLIGGGIRLNGQAPVRLPASPSLVFAAGQAATWSMWVKPDKDTATAVLYTQRDGATGLTIGLDQRVAYAQLDGPDGSKRTSPGAAIAGEGWHHVAVVVTDKLAVFVDGKPAGEVAAALPALTGQGVLGGSLPVTAAATPAAAPGPAMPGAVPGAAVAAPAETPAPGNLVGSIDEFEISKTSRPAGAIQLAVANQGPDPKLLVFEQAEQSSFFGSGYIGIIMGSVTPDAWVVIGILLVMAVTSWWVMVSKAIYLSRLASANALFREEYDRAMAASGDNNRAAFSGISDTDRPKLKRSSLYRLYAVGSHQLNQRLGGGTLEPTGVLAPQSIAAIRAAIDAGMVRETQRLNKLMVMLTIAISGGPFLGLLGTVVGVMITFAAIAQAGDVNVNAIAPGVSAALLATVAGLAVAIPALFGYNYFLIRIRDATADMSSFIDELVTRMGEGFRAPQPREIFHAPAGISPSGVVGSQLQPGE